nr:trypsin-like peptidase domain-containing protein [uncultured Albidiferax sp.]
MNLYNIKNWNKEVEILVKKKNLGQVGLDHIYPGDFPEDINNICKKLLFSCTKDENPFPGIKDDIKKEFFPLSAMKSIGLISSKHSRDLSNNPIPIGTCFLVGPQWVLTAHHVLPSHEFAQNFWVVFGFINEKDKTMSELFEAAQKIEFSCSNKFDYYSSVDGARIGNGHEYEAGDWVLIKLKNEPEGIYPISPRTVVASDFESGNRSFVIPYYLSKMWSPEKVGVGFPSAEGDMPDVAPLHVLITPKNHSKFEDAHRLMLYPGFDFKNSWKIRHFISAASGASGAPLMDSDGKFVGLHVQSEKVDKGVNPGVASNAHVIATDLEALDFPFNDEGVTLIKGNFK